jgi:DHA1 family multidrug resistance protein-like MFS transporter
MNSAQIGLLLFLMNITSGVIRIPVGIASDKYGQKIFLIASAVCFASSGFLFLIFETFEALIIPEMLWGIAGGLYHTVSWIYVANISTPDTRTKAYGTLGLFQTAGGIMGPYVGGLLADKFGLKASFVSVTAICIIGVAVSLKLRDVKRPIDKRPQFSESLKALRKMQLISLVAVFSSLYLIRGVYQGIYQPGIPLFLKNIRGLDYSQIGLIATGQSIGSGVGHLICLRLPAGTNLKKLVGYSSLFNFLLIMIFLIDNSPIMFFANTFLLGFSMSFGIMGTGSGPVSSALFIGTLPLETRGFASGISGLAWRAGLSLGSLIMAPMWLAFGMESMFYLFAAIFVTEFVSFSFYYRVPSKKQKSKEKEQ